MPKPSWSGDVSRKIVRRIVIEGDLILLTPAHFGNGDGNNLVDMPLLTDSLDDKVPLLTGSSIAGALRGYLQEREYGFRARVDSNVDTSKSSGKPSSVLLFGSNRGDNYGEQSPLIIEDTYGINAAVELRDGVRLAGDSRTAEHDKLFNIEMWEAGTTFPLRFELIVRQDDNTFDFKQAIATALAGFNDGDITIGARKRRGYGQVGVTDWRVKEYDLTNTEELLDWIENGAKEISGTSNPDIMHALGISKKITDQRQAFRLKAEFSLDGSLLIRSGIGPDIEQADANSAMIQRPDFIHLHSARPVSNGTKEPQPIVSGTSLTGALRARAFKIAQLIASPTKEGEEEASKLIDAIFGANMDTAKEPQASRIIVREHVVKGDFNNTSVQNRVSLDRFTGGTRDGALFNEQPLFSGKESVVTVELLLEKPQDYEIGLLLFLLKDLWTGDLPLGGEISIGRGRLRGKSCHLEHQNRQMQTWDLLANENDGLSLTTGEQQELENYVSALHTSKWE